VLPRRSGGAHHGGFAALLALGLPLPVRAERSVPVLSTGWIAPGLGRWAVRSLNRGPEKIPGRNFEAGP
jgi:hypothetical protein